METGNFAAETAFSQNFQTRKLDEIFGTQLFLPTPRFNSIFFFHSFPEASVQAA